MNPFTTDHPMAQPTRVSPRVRQIIRWALVPFGVLTFYIGCFIWRFDVLSLPVRDNVHGWLGPLIRGDSHSICIGDVYFYEGTDFTLYDFYHPLCALWLLATVQQ